MQPTSQPPTSEPEAPKRLKLIACEILYREFCAAAAESNNLVDVEFLTKGLHDIGQEGMSATLKEAVEAVDESQYDAILMGYALCSNGIVGLTAGSIPLVLPRAHDCITLFLGSHERYVEYFHAHPGVYYKTSGWIERGDGLAQSHKESMQEKTGLGQTYEEMVEKYGEDNAKFLYDQLGDMTRNYTGLTFIEMGVGPEARLEAQIRRQAEENGWKFDKLAGDMSLIRSLVNGPWDNERFLVVPPGGRVVGSYGEDIIEVES